MQVTPLLQVFPGIEFEEILHPTLAQVLKNHTKITKISIALRLLFSRKYAFLLASPEKMAKQFASQFRKSP
jgi:hypothetical protein